MVFLAISLCTRGGKALVSRQYVEMSRLRIEGMLSAFPKLVAETDGPNKKVRQHTFVETDSVRYIYQPVEDLYLIVITTKGSNIIQDLETLRLLSKILPDYCQPINETTISENVFELVYAFDEVITLGFKENLSVQEIRTNLAMESHEEKLFDMLRQSKEDDAKQEMRRKAAAIRAAQRETQKDSALTGIGNKNYEPDYKIPQIEKTEQYDLKKEEKKDSDIIGVGGMKLGKGMSLKKKAKGKGLEFMSEFAKEEGIDEQSLEQQTTAQSTANQGLGVPLVPKEDIEIEILENVTCILLSDGSVSNFEVKGQMSILCQKDDTKVCVQLAKESLKGDSGFKLTSSPKLSKPDLANNLLKLRQADRPFPGNSKFNMLNWKLKSDSEELLPLKILFWPEKVDSKTDSSKPNASTFNVSIELNLNENFALGGLDDLLLKVPLGKTNAVAKPEVINIENGLYRFNSRKNQLEWEIGLMNDQNKTGMLEFEVDAKDVQDFFPVEVTFSSRQSLFPIDINSVVDLDSGQEQKYEMIKQLKVDSYEVEYE